MRAVWALYMGDLSGGCETDLGGFGTCGGGGFAR